MNGQSNRLSVSPVGRAVAQSVLHPTSAHQLLEYSARCVAGLLTLADDENSEHLLRFILLHAAYSCDEYSQRSGGRSLPYQLDPLVPNGLANQSNDYLFEQPWNRNPKSANAAMLAMRWVEGRPRNELVQEFEAIGSGVLQTMFREGADILFGWSDCLLSATDVHLSNEDRPQRLRGDTDLLQALRNVVAAIRAQTLVVSIGLPGEAAWMAQLNSPETGQQILPRRAIFALFSHGLVEPVDLLRHETFKEIIDVLHPLNLVNLDQMVRRFREAIRRYRKDRRENLWGAAIRRAPDNYRAVMETMKVSRETDFESCVEDLLDRVGIAYCRVDDGSHAGAPDLHLGLNHEVQVVVELKTAQGEGAIGLNPAKEVISAASIVELGHLPKVTLANPGFDPNVPWQTRKATELALVEACQFAYGISLVARGDVSKDAFLGWLSQPGMLSVTQLRKSIYQD